jgi:hypothetical protein
MGLIPDRAALVEGRRLEFKALLFELDANSNIYLVRTLYSRTLTHQRRFAKSLPVCAMGARAYAVALRAFARSDFWFVKEFCDLVLIGIGDRHYKTAA